MCIDSAIPTPQLNATSQPTVAPPDPLTAFPTFVYFEPGKSLIPVSSFGTTLAVAGALRSNCQFEHALKWCQEAFDPLTGDNTWLQCPKPISDTSVSGLIQTRTSVSSAPATVESTAVVPSSGITSTTTTTAPTQTSSSAPPQTSGFVPAPSAASPASAVSKDAHAPVDSKETEPGLSIPSQRPSVQRHNSGSTVNAKVILTPATTPGATDSVKTLDTRDDSSRDLPYCPISPVGGGIARARAVLLEYLEILLEWGDHLLSRNSLEASEQALVIFNIADRILGPKPTQVKAHDSTPSMTIANFKASPGPLNPRLLQLYDQFADRRILVHESANSRRLRNGEGFKSGREGGSHHRQDIPEAKVTLW
jgi:hypothetical protein